MGSVVQMVVVTCVGVATRSGELDVEFETKRSAEKEVECMTKGGL